LEEKYEKARNSLKDLEMSYGTKIIELERDKAVSKEKLLNLANLLDSNSQSSNDQVKTLQVKISDLEVKSTKEIV